MLTPTTSRLASSSCRSFLQSFGKETDYCTASRYMEVTGEEWPADVEAREKKKKKK